MKKFLASVIVLMVSMYGYSAWADDPVAGPGKKVTFDYTLTVDKKEMESSRGKAPLSYVSGMRQIIPGLESQINGMHLNEEKVINVAPKDAYGDVDPRAFKEFPLSSLPPGTSPKVGMILRATAPDGTKYPAFISDVKGDKIVVNFNHPLAGKNLTFKVKVVKIENAPSVAPMERPASAQK
jgi:FKBP-type peptidyl-prolyl cis-trans isomerase SlyD